MRKMLVLVLSLVGMQAVAIPVAGAETPDFVTGTYTVTSDLSSLEMTTRGHQCILHIENTITFSGDLGVAETAGPAEVRFPVPCDELVAGVPRSSMTSQTWC